MFELSILEICLIVAIGVVILGQGKSPHFGKVDVPSISEYIKATSVLREAVKDVARMK